MNRGFTAACLLLAASCSDWALEVEFAETPLTAGDAGAWAQPMVQSANGEITVRRTMVTPSACRELDAELVRTGSDLTLRVTSREAGTGCPAGEGRWGSVAEIHGLRRGSYNLQVVHTYADPRRPSEVVLRQPIFVE